MATDPATHFGYLWSCDHNLVLMSNPVYDSALQWLHTAILSTSSHVNIFNFFILSSLLAKIAI